MKLRIGVVQISPKIGQVQANLSRARDLCKGIKPGSVDLLCFPEMAFSGYVFKGAADISPHLEDPHTGPTGLFCAELAKRLGCYVLAGYPERLSEEELATPELEPPIGASPTRVVVGANSTAFYGPDGNQVGEYRKTNLYVTDMTWAKPGSGFQTFTFPDSRLPKLGLGICMDLNPFPESYEADGGEYEVAQFCVENKVKVLVLLNAWLDSGVTDEDIEDGEKHDWSTLDYWASRLYPLWERPNDNGEDEDAVTDEDGEETIVVVCNRAGVENGITFAGTSSIFSMVRGFGRPKLLDMLTRTEEEVRIWNIDI